MFDTTTSSLQPLLKLIIYMIYMLLHSLICFQPGIFTIYIGAPQSKLEVDLPAEEEHRLRYLEPFTRKEVEHLISNPKSVSPFPFPYLIYLLIIPL